MSTTRDPGTLSVGELRTFLQDLPAEMEVWGTGYEMGADVASGVRVAPQSRLVYPRRLIGHDHIEHFNVVVIS